MESNNENIRFKDEGNTIGAYTNRIFVHCPKCEKRALVTNEGKLFASELKLHCPNCHYSQKGLKKTYNLELRYLCLNCVEKVEKTIENITVKKEEIKVKCPNCNVTQTQKPTYIEQNWVFGSQGEAADPYYNLPLWLSGRINDETFIAYNYEHLKDLKGYISAKLRIRSDKNYMTMVEKLPDWIKSKKNRDVLEKLIEKLEKK